MILMPVPSDSILKFFLVAAMKSRFSSRRCGVFQQIMHRLLELDDIPWFRWRKALHGLACLGNQVFVVPHKELKQPVGGWIRRTFSQIVGGERTILKGKVYALVVIRRTEFPLVPRLADADTTGVVKSEPSRLWERNVSHHAETPVRLHLQKAHEYVTHGSRRRPFFKSPACGDPVGAQPR